MAFTATTQWDVRTTGSDTNGGGFDTATAGTDYSQQNAAQVTYTDLVIDAATNTKCTSAANPFTAAHVGNIINITSGTGFTVQRVQVVSVAAGVATCDKSLGTLSSTGGNGKLGGALATPAAAAAVLVHQNTVHVKAGTYTFTATLALIAAGQFWWGFNTTHRDGGTRPLFTTATDSTILVTCPGSKSVLFRNINFSNTAAVRSSGIGPVGSEYVEVSDCKFTGFTNAISTSYIVLATGCEFTLNTLAGVLTGTYGALQGCYFHDNLKDDFFYTGTVGMSVTRCIFANTPRYAMGSNSNDAQIAAVANCVFYKCGKTFAGNPFPAILGGLGYIDALLVNNIFYGGGATPYYGPDVSNGPGTTVTLGRNNAIDSQGMTFYSSVGDVLLTADPFTNAAGGDYTLNATAGGGLLCKAAGYPGAGFGGATAGTLDIGAVQSGAASGGGQKGYPV